MKFPKNGLLFFSILAFSFMSIACMDKNRDTKITDETFEEINKNLDIIALSNLFVALKENKDNIDQAFKLIDDALPLITNINQSLFTDKQITILDLAFDLKKIPILKKLFQAGARCSSERSVKQFKIAAITGNIDMAQFLLEINPVLLEKWQEYNIVSFAAQNGHFEFIEMLIQKGLPLKERLLHEAAFFGHLDWVQKFIQLGYDVHAQNSDGYTPLLEAVSSDKVDVEKRKQIIIALLKAGAKLSDKTKENIDALAVAAFNGDVEIGSFLIDLDPKLFDTYYAAEKAGAKGHFNFIRMLIQKGAHLNGQNVLHYAAYYGNLALAKQLVGQGFDETELDKSLTSPLDYAALENHDHIVEFFIRHLIDSGKIKEMGNQPLHLACLYAHTGLVEEFIKRGDNINVRNNDGESPIFCAIGSNCDFQKRKQIIGKLLYAKAHLDAKQLNNNGVGALSKAVSHVDIDMVKFLLQILPDDMYKLHEVCIRIEQFPSSKPDNIRMIMALNPSLSENRIKANLIEIEKILKEEYVRLNKKLIQPLHSTHTQKNSKLETKKIKEQEKAQKRAEAEKAAKKKQEEEENERLKQEQARKAKNAKKKAKKALDKEKQKEAEKKKDSEKLTTDVDAQQLPEVHVPSPRNARATSSPVSSIPDNQATKFASKTQNATDSQPIKSDKQGDEVEKGAIKAKEDQDCIDPKTTEELKEHIKDLHDLLKTYQSMLKNIKRCLKHKEKLSAEQLEQCLKQQPVLEKLIPQVRQSIAELTLLLQQHTNKE